MLPSKGVDTKKIWSLDDIDTISKDLNEKLKLHYVQGDQNTNIRFEILRWCRIKIILMICTVNH